MEFFREEVHLALAHQKLDPSEQTVWYLVQLLDAFVQPREMFRRAGVEPDRPLAEIFLRAFHCEKTRKMMMLRLAGDLSLFISGFLAESLVRQTTGPGYYVKLGAGAYHAVGHETRIAAEIYLELAENFVGFADVFSAISERVALSDERNQLRLYERWLETGSTRSAEALRAQGILVVPTSREVQ